MAPETLRAWVCLGLFWVTGIGPKFFQRLRLDQSSGHVELQCHASRERVGALHHLRQAADALGSHVALGGNLSLCTVEIHPNQHPKLVCRPQNYPL